VAVDAGVRDADEDRQEQAAGLGPEQRPPSLELQPDGGEEAGRPQLAIMLLLANLSREGGFWLNAVCTE
jgi:hypothetical protein